MTLTYCHVLEQLAHLLESRVLSCRGGGVQPAAARGGLQLGSRIWAKGWFRRRLAMTAGQLFYHSARYFFAARHHLWQVNTCGIAVDATRLSKRSVLYGAFSTPGGTAGWLLPKVFFFEFFVLFCFLGWEKESADDCSKVWGPKKLAKF